MVSLELFMSFWHSFLTVLVMRLIPSFIFVKKWQPKGFSQSFGFGEGFGERTPFFFSMPGSSKRGMVDGNQVKMKRLLCRLARWTFMVFFSSLCRYVEVIHQLVFLQWDLPALIPNKLAWTGFALNTLSIFVLMSTVEKMGILDMVRRSFLEVLKSSKQSCRHIYEGNLMGHKRVHTAFLVIIHFCFWFSGWWIQGPYHMFCISVV